MLPTSPINSWPICPQVVAAAFAQYFIFAMVLFVVLCAATTGIFYLSVLTINHNMPIRSILEVVITLIITKLLITFGNRFIFRDGDLSHPVLWTWYSTYLLIINLVKGVFTGFVRMATMFFWVVVFIGKIDRSNFPEGQESSDAAFCAFFQTLNFHHRSFALLPTDTDTKTYLPPHRLKLLKAEYRIVMLL
jgi:hypothetical protein